MFNFESICVTEDAYKQTETATWIGKHVPISISISSNLIPEPIFGCKANPDQLILSFITALEGLATESKAQMKLIFLGRDCNQDKTVCYTGTTQPRTAPSREAVKHCRSLFPGGGKGFIIYTIPANAKES